MATILVKASSGSGGVLRIGQALKGAKFLVIVVDERKVGDVIVVNLELVAADVAGAVGLVVLLDEACDLGVVGSGGTGFMGSAFLTGLLAQNSNLFLVGVLYRSTACCGRPISHMCGCGSGSTLCARLLGG